MQNSILFRDKTGFEMTYILEQVDLSQHVLSILMPNTEEGRIFITNMMNTPVSVRERHLEAFFQWGEQACRADILACTSCHFTTGESSKIKVTLRTLKITSENECPKGVRLLFYIPYKSDYDTGMRSFTKDIEGVSCRRDRTSFCYGGRDWILRTAFCEASIPTQPLPFDLTSRKMHTGVCGLFLETNCEDADTLHDQLCNVSEMCSLMSLALGVHIHWVTAWYIEGGLMHFHSTSGHIHEQKKAYRPLVLENEFNWHNPCLFLETACSFFKDNPEWWRTTILWYINGKLRNALEVNKMIESMLFDRITKKIFSVVVKEALNLELRSINSSKEFANKIKDVLGPKIEQSINTMQTAPSEDMDFLGMCKAWLNSNNTYLGRIKAVMTYIGVTIDSDDEAELKKRNFIIHEGELPDVTEDIFAYDNKITKYCLMLILPMLGYGGRFTTRTADYVISDAAKNWEKLRIPKIRETARRLLK